jgi:hypothetical protein
MKQHWIALMAAAILASLQATRLLGSPQADGSAAVAGAWGPK